MPSAAWAYWSSEGGATGSAKVATLPLPIVTAVSPQYSDEVEVSWTEPNVPSGMAITGYRVVRIAGGTPTPACGSTPSTPLPPSTLSCVDSGLADGDADYVVTAVVGAWTTTGTTPDPVTVAADRTAPTIALSGAAGCNALIERRYGSDLLFFRPADGGSIRIDAELTDSEVGPESATFPAVSAVRLVARSGDGELGDWLVADSDLSLVGAGLRARGGHSCAHRRDGTDTRGNERTRMLTFVADADPPTGGAVTVNGVRSRAAGTAVVGCGRRLHRGGDDPVRRVGVDRRRRASPMSTLTRESAVLAGGSCGPFGGGTLG